MATKKTSIETSKFSIESLKNELELMKYEFGTLKELVSRTYLPYGVSSGAQLYGDFAGTKYLYPHISYQFNPDRKTVKITGQSFSTPTVISLPQMYNSAKVFVQFSHIIGNRNGQYFSLQNSTHIVKINENGDFNVDVNIEDKMSNNKKLRYSVKISAVDLKTGHMTNVIFLDFAGTDLPDGLGSEGQGGLGTGG